jgi:hypothetical protein
MSGPTTSTISGRVVDADGLPVAGATVAVVSSDGPHRDIAVRTAADGSFRLGGLPSGRVELEARRSGLSGSVTVQVVLGKDLAPVEIRLGEPPEPQPEE